MAKGNDGNYLQHSVEVAAAARLARTDPDGRLHVALTHGMEPFERIDEPKGNAHKLLYGALREAAGEPECNEREIVKAYREAWASQPYRPDSKNLFKELKSERHYPNSAELLRAVVGTKGLSGGIAELNESKHKKLAAAWIDSKVVVACSSWRKQLSPVGALGCPNCLDAPWLFSMDPMTYYEKGDKEKIQNLNGSDLDLLAHALARYIDSGQPGIASLFVYSVGSQRENGQRQFWGFMDELSKRLSVRTSSYWVRHRGGNCNLAGLLFSGIELSDDFVLPNINAVRDESC